jgi:hypothetical protein
MRLAQDDKMIHTLAPDRSDQPFGEAVLPRRGWCSGLVPDTHGTQSARDDGAVDPISIANEVLRGVIPRKCLARNPFCRRVRGDVDPDEVSAVQAGPTGSPAIPQPSRRHKAIKALVAGGYLLRQKSEPFASKCRLKRLNSFSISPDFPSTSRNSHSVVPSGMRSSMPS